MTTPLLPEALKALRDYVRHKWNCQAMEHGLRDDGYAGWTPIRTPTGRPCDCGLDALLILLTSLGEQRDTPPDAAAPLQSFTSDTKEKKL